MKPTRSFVVAAVLVIGVFGGATSAAAQCAEGPTKAVCSAATDALAKVRELRPQVAPAHECSLDRIEDRLEGFLSGLPEVRGLLPLEFAENTAAITQGGQEFEQTVLFQSESDEVILSTEEGATPLPGTCSADERQREALSSALRPIRLAVAVYNKPILTSGAAQLRKLSNTWTWIITDGFGQFPWERLFNDLVHREPMSIFKLPRVEWVVVHPSVGASFTSFNSFEDTYGQVSFLVEPFGVTFYNFDVDTERRNYWGVSSLVMITENLPMAVGGLLRLNKYSLGLVRHLNLEDGSGQWSVTATIELIERLQPARKKLQELQGRAARATSALTP